MILVRLAIKEMKRRPGRAVLTLLSIIIGVAAVLAVRLATENAHAAYEQMYTSLAGRASLEVVASDGGTFPTRLVSELTATPGVQAAAGAIQRFGTLFHHGGRLRLIVLGIDPQRDREVRDFDLVDGRYVQDETGAMLDASFARAIGVQTGDEIRVLTGRTVRPHRLTIIGLLSPRGATGFSQAGTLFIPLETAQEWYGQPGNVDSISIVLNPGSDEAAVRESIAARLPQGVTVRTPAARTRLARGTLMNAEQGLAFGSLLVLVLAVFIILNTFLMNLSERRRQLAVLRAIGATRPQIMGMVLAEAAAMGLVGTALGCAIGPIGARFILGAIAQVLGAAPPALQLSAGPFVTAALVGPIVSVVAAGIPAWFTGRISPLEGIRPVVTLHSSGVPRWMTIGGAALSVLAGLMFLACIAGWLPVSVALPLGAVFLAAPVLVFPALVGPLASALSVVLSPVLGVEGRLGCVQLLRRRVRTGLTIGVVYIAIAAGVGMGTTIINNVQDVRNWYRRTMDGNFVVRAMAPDAASGQGVSVPAELVQTIRQIDGVVSVDTVKFMLADVGDLPVVVAVREFADRETLALDLTEGDPVEVRRRLFQGEAAIGTVLAQRAGLHVGDELEIQTAHGPKRFRIAGTAVDYMVGGLVVHLERSTAAKVLPIEGADAFVIHAAPDRLAEVERELKGFAEEHGLMLHSRAELSGFLDTIMGGVVRSLWGVLALGCVVAGFGVANTLTMNVLEQTREIALLRVVAMTRRQVRRMVVAQAIVMGLIGLISGTIAGVNTAWFTKETMVPLLGYPIEFTIHPTLLAGSFVVALAIVLLAAFFPAERAARLNLLIALQYE